MMHERENVMIIMTECFVKLTMSVCYEMQDT